MNHLPLIIPSNVTRAPDRFDEELANMNSFCSLRDDNGWAVYYNLSFHKGPLLLASKASDIPWDDGHDELDSSPWMEENGGLS